MQLVSSLMRSKGSCSMWRLHTASTRRANAAPARKQGLASLKLVRAALVEVFACAPKAAAAAVHTHCVSGRRLETGLALPEWCAPWKAAVKACELAAAFRREAFELP